VNTKSTEGFEAQEGTDQPPPRKIDQDIEAFADLAATLADPAVDRAAILEAHGLDEDRWEALDNAWQARISAEEQTCGDNIPPLLTAYSNAFVRAQRARQKTALLPFEKFIELVRALRYGGDAAATLQRFGTTFPAFLASQQHWMDLMMKDEELSDRWRRAMR
jgi:hypothetical protein